MHPCPRWQRADSMSFPFLSCGLRAHSWGRSLFRSVGGHIPGNSWVWWRSGLMSYPHGEHGLPTDQHLRFSFPSCPQSLFGCNQCDVGVWLPGYFSRHNCSYRVCTNTGSCKGKEADPVVCPQPWSQKEMLGLSNLALSVMSQHSLRNTQMRSNQNVF